MQITMFRKFAIKGSEGDAIDALSSMCNVF